MKHKLIVSILAVSSAILITGCGKSGTSGASSGGTAGGVALALDYPPELIEGTPKAMTVPNLVQVPDKAPTFLVPKEAVLLSKDKKVTGSDDNPIIGDLKLITDGDKQAGEGYFVEILEGPQWVQIDLEKSAAINAVCVWHYHSQKRAYKGVVIQISDDAKFAPAATTTIYNNDYENVCKLGKGTDNPYVESRFGLIADGKGTKGRYVRLYSNGNTSNDMNHYIEVEVYGVPQ
ncbi:MAG: discoidin domain-containing protein [Verrucomicrobiota bacterium]